jgi:hypothetical protein
LAHTDTVVTVATSSTFSGPTTTGTIITINTAIGINITTTGITTTEDHSEVARHRTTAPGCAAQGTERIMKSRQPYSRILPRATGRFRVYCLPFMALAIAMTLGGCVVYVPGQYHGGWHHHYYGWSGGPQPLVLRVHLLIAKSFD